MINNSKSNSKYCTVICPKCGQETRFDMRSLS